MSTLKTNPPLFKKMVMGNGYWVLGIGYWVKGIGPKSGDVEHLECLTNLDLYP